MRRSLEKHGPTPLKRLVFVLALLGLCTFTRESSAFEPYVFGEPRVGLLSVEDSSRTKLSGGLGLNAGMGGDDDSPPIGGFLGFQVGYWWAGRSNGFWFIN